MTDHEVVVSEQDMRRLKRILREHGSVEAHFLLGILIELKGKLSIPKPIYDHIKEVEKISNV